MNRSVFALFAALALLGCGKREEAAVPPIEAHGHDQPHADGVGELTPEAAKAAGIEVQALEPSAFLAEETVPGVVATFPGRQAVVTPPVSGRILRLLVTVGDPVRQGQPIAVIESVDLAERANAVAEAERAVAAAQGELARTESERALAQARTRASTIALVRQRELARTGAFSQPSLQAAERELNDARAALESAQREAVVHRTQLERAERLYRQELVSRIEVENARLDVEKDRIAQERAERAIAIARSAFERERGIAGRGLSNAREVQTAEAEVRTARLEAERATIAVRSARSALVGARGAVVNARAAYAALKGETNQAQGGRLTLVAPLDGRVVHHEATVGQAVERTAELFEIDDLREVLVVAQVPEGAVAGLRRGTPATITTDAGRRFAGSVETIGGRMDPKTRTLPVGCRVPNGDGALRPEMFVQVGLGKGRLRSTLVLPGEATFEEDGKNYVFVEASTGHYERREVGLGRTHGGKVELRSGLKGGERVVTAGVFTLRSQAQKDELKGHED